MKKITFLLIGFILCFSSQQLRAQTVFDWETAVDNGPNVTQTVSGIIVTVTASSGDITYVDGAGYNGSSGNIIAPPSANVDASMTVSFNQAVDIATVFALDADATTGSTWTFTPTGGSNSPVDEFVPHNAGVTVNLNWTNVTSFIITTSQSVESFGLDDITLAAACTAPDVPTVTSTPATVCTGGTASLNISGALNDATAWHIYTGSCGGTQIGTTTTGTFAIPGTISSSTTYFVRGEGGCVTPGSCGTVTITPQALDDASFNYGAASYCANDADPTPTITGTTGGTFSSTAGLSINASNGTIDVSASTPGIYTVTYTTAGTCPNSSNVSVTINAVDDASFNYSTASYCVNDADPTPTITGTTGGTFSSTAGLSINASNGTIDVSASTPNSYIVTYTTTGTCPNSSNVIVTINALDDASFSYSAASYCVSDVDPTPTITGLGGGTFSSTAGLSINASTGAIDVSASTPNSYIVTYTTAGTCPNSSNVSVTINASDDASFSYSAASYCVSDTDPTPTITGLTGGTFSSTLGLTINASTGVIDVSASNPNTYTVTYTTAGACPNSSNVSVTINDIDDTSFSYGAINYCVNDADPTPTITGLAGGTFSSTPSVGLSINTSTGTIDVSASTPNSYIVTYTTSGTCPNSSNIFVAINALDDASFNYNAASYTSTDSDPTPTITGLGGGTFSSTAGLSINASTGAIDVSTSIPNTYTVTYTTAGTCPNSSNVSVTITGTYTWTGATDNDWNTASNWNYNAVPSTNADIVIPSGLTNYPTASSAVTFNSLTINNGASFIPQSTVTGTVTYKRSLPTTNWYLVSPPVVGETIQDVIANHTLASGTGGNLGLAPYSNITGPAWLYAQTSSTGTVTSGTGVSIKLASPGDVSITGTINTSNVSKGITTGSRTNYNLIGNPYTSYINSANFAAANTVILTEETIWLWNGSQYITKNAIEDIEIAPGQGFFVEAAASSNVIFAFSNQSHQNSDTFMRQEPIPSIELSVNNSDIKRSTKVFYASGKTTGYDKSYDSKMFGEDTSGLAVFTELLTNNQGKQLAIQTLPDNDYENMVVPVGLRALNGEEVTFSINTKNIPANLKVYLEDRINNVFTNLSEENYTTTLNKDSNSIGQFYLHTSSEKPTSIIQPSIDNISIYSSSNNEITIIGLQTKANVAVYSILGKEILNKNITSNGVSKISLPNISTGVYIVKLNSDLGEISKKVILK
ncbi:beta strand repeat-containing protein [Tenacibaculum gallaicum]|nr:T9SS type A sorting domain-containing protein [Tenacibaculum gallaicum]